MKSSNQLANRALSNVSSKQPSSGWQSGEQLETAVAWLWSMMTQRYGHQWSSAFGSSPSQAWTLSIGALGAEAVKRGYKRIVAERLFTDWPPTLPQFEQACEIKPSDVGCPDIDEAWQNAQKNAYPYAKSNWAHKAVWWAACKTGMTEIAENRKNARKEFEQQYMRAIERLDLIDEPPMACIESKPVRDNQAGEKAIEDIMRILRGATA